VKRKGLGTPNKKNLKQTNLKHVQVIQGSTWKGMKSAYPSLKDVNMEPEELMVRR